MSPPSKISTVHSIEKAATKFIEITGEDAFIRFDTGGVFNLPLDPDTGWVLDIRGYRRVSIYISSQKATQRTLYMGRLSGVYAAQTYPLYADKNIHTFDVVGPEMGILLNGPREASEQIECWVYLSA